ncbi:hypothetical protein KIL84_006896 [Mauremys mutica]|uniref:Uncharacterized protein n=1 Tax=Mauremys mutica TaxID=74926 RepID=A0A9D3X1P9_9SAUR|nr:hypothetical protein KIL84_006896 [Mauremys mutica]
MCFIFQKINMSQIYYTQSHSCYLIISMHISCKCSATEEVHYLLYPAIKPDLELLCSSKPELISCLSTFCNAFITGISTIFVEPLKLSLLLPASPNKIQTRREHFYNSVEMLWERHLMS